jgi:hypothetical protein
MNHVVMRSQVFAHLKSSSPDKCFLEESHLRSSDQDKLKRGWVDQIFHSNVGAQATGAAILIRKGTPFVSSEVISDTNGRYIIVMGKLISTQVVLANLYGPN